MIGSESPQPSTPRVLVVDDVADNRDLLQALLEGEGYVVETAAEGYTAIAKIEQHSPNLILLDLMMPDLDGYEVARWIAQNHRAIPILFVTGYPDLLNLNGYMDLAVDYILKPIDFEELLSKTRSLISK